MSQVFEPEPIEEQHGFFKQYVKIAGRKARCALCHGKILVDVPYSINNGLICHDACIEETKNLDNNVRRRTLKLMGIGAAFAGATAIGASKLVSASGVQQTQITANGVILPSLTSDPANPQPGQMWYRSDAGVTAHFDAIENRVIYSNRIVNGSAVVTAKGIVNGLSVLPNDGQDWGPDTMLGATAPGQYGPSYTMTVGIKEAANYLSSQGGEIVLMPDNYIIDETITIISNFNITIVGNVVGWVDHSNGYYEPVCIAPSSSFSTGDYLINAYSTRLNSGILSLINICFAGAVNAYGYANLSNNIANGVTSTPTSGNYVVAGFRIYSCRFQNCLLAINQSNAGGPTFINDIHFTYCNSIIVSIANAYCMNWEINACGVNNYYTISFGTATTNTPNTFILSNINFSGMDSTINAGNVPFLINGGTIIISGLNCDGYGITDRVFNIIAGNMIIDSAMFGHQNPLPSGTTVFAGSGTFTGSISNVVVNGGPVTFWYAALYNSSRIMLSNISGAQGPSTFNSPAINIGGSNNTAVMSIINSPDILNQTPPAITANPPVTATVYQNTNPYDIEIDLPVYATTSGTAGYVTIAKGATSTPTAIGNQYVNGATSSTSTDIIKLRVPAGWYYSFTASGVTFGTASVFAD